MPYVDVGRHARLRNVVIDRGVNLLDVANIYGYGECEEILPFSMGTFDRTERRCTEEPT